VIRRSERRGGRGNEWYGNQEGKQYGSDRRRVQIIDNDTSQAVV
jgi:hypothetical protein